MWYNFYVSLWDSSLVTTQANERFESEPKILHYLYNSSISQQTGTARFQPGRNIFR
jgi:hypothetical protein